MNYSKLESYSMSPAYLKDTEHSWLSCILFYDTEELCWVAHCLEFNSLTTGKDKKTAIDRLAVQCATEFRVALESNTSPFNPAPKERWDMLSKALVARNTV